MPRVLMMDEAAPFFSLGVRAAAVGGDVVAMEKAVFFMVGDACTVRPWPARTDVGTPK